MSLVKSTQTIGFKTWFVRSRALSGFTAISINDLEASGFIRTAINRDSFVFMGKVAMNRNWHNGLGENVDEHGFRQGDRIAITDGPFSGFDGTIETVDEVTSNAIVTLQIFGRQTPIDFPTDGFAEFQIKTLTADAEIF